MAKTSKFDKAFNDLKKMIEKADASSLEGSFAFQCCITGEGEGTFYFALNDGKLTAEPYDYKEHTAVFKASAETYKDILSGKISAEEAVKSGALIVEDNEYTSCADILTTLSGKAPAKKAAAKKEAAPKKAAPAKKAAPKAAAKKEAKPAAEAKPAVKAEVKPEAKAEAKPAAKGVRTAKKTTK